MSDADAVVRAVADGHLAILPTDTVYGLACTAFGRQPAVDLYRLKGRSEIQPTALVAASIEALLECLPELRDGAEAQVRALLPGPFTLVVANPARRFTWLSQGRPDTIGVRVPALVGAAADVLGRLRAIVATSANLPGGQDPRRLEEVPAEILAGVAATLDGGELPGTPSTVIDLTGPDPIVLREGAGDPAAAFHRVTAHTQSLPLDDGALTREG